MGKLFKTGWQRRKDGAAPAIQEAKHDGHEGEMKIQTVQVTHTVEHEVATKTALGDDQTPVPAQGEATSAKALVNEADAP